ncbi:SDR family oxidoreductase [Mycolicibacterium mucogenicum]|uniref:SDR family NAD(P)-dependent oxidoreductase n=1 Tax=Mycolicibacterium mucogenicum TaxID=56689 RepID=UPI00226A0CD0|nr:SDR family oxidoreductase [Mycolicibacterium mucogenicum]MCX8563027.1 SDR family oxidoreductase [Mycolicibacterium mucogenicum]
MIHRLGGKVAVITGAAKGLGAAIARRFAAEGAIDALTRALSNELAPQDIRVNAIKPGVVDTDGVEAGFLTNRFGQAIIEETPLGRLGLPTDIAPAGVYLASDEIAWMTGEYTTLSGGQR